MTYYINRYIILTIDPFAKLTRFGQENGCNICSTGHAVEAKPEGGMSKNDPRFTAGEYVQLTVSDSGCGMHKVTLDKIFDPFFSTKSLANNAGLGLSSVYGIIKQNNGTIDIHSKIGEGTTVEIYLPRQVIEQDVINEEQPI